MRSARADKHSAALVNQTERETNDTMNYQELYQSKLGTLEGALKLIRSGDVIGTPIYANEPSHFLRNLHTIALQVENVSLWTMLLMGNYPIMTDNSLAGHIDIYTYFYNNNCRDGHATRRFQYVPTDLHRVDHVIAAAKKVTVFVAAVSPMDEHGNVYLSFDMEAGIQQFRTADLVIFEVNPNIPRVFGETALPIQQADYIYEATTPLPIAPIPTATDIDLAIAQNVVSLIKDGDCIQLGIGGMPNAVGEALMDKKDLGIHTEMITTSMGKLLNSGVVTNARKNFNTGKTVGAFAWGDQALYDYMTENPNVMMRQAAWVNNPANIARNDNMVSVNAAIQVDLTGQICSESMGSRQYSGSGGALDFAYGAMHSKGGRGIIALPSTAKGGTVSKIQPTLSLGAAVTIPRNSADYIVTEYGIAPLRGRSLRQRVGKPHRHRPPGFPCRAAPAGGRADDLVNASFRNARAQREDPH